MLYQAKEGVLTLPGGEMEYIRFGSGAKIMVMLPGLGDGLRTMKGTALPVAFAYRVFAKEYTVYAFSRLRCLPQGYTTRDMARDQALAMEALDIEKADVFGVSMGGMIAQHLAADFPEKVAKLVLAVTCAGTNPILVESVEEWIRLARKGDHTAFMESNLRRIYSGDYCRKNRWTLPLLGLLTKPKSYDRFYIQADACLTHDSRDRLSRIQAPTLVVGGEKDLSLGGDASRELAEKIPGAQLYMYPQWGHGLYEEAGDFNGRILDFFRREAV